MCCLVRVLFDYNLYSPHSVAKRMAHNLPLDRKHHCELSAGVLCENWGSINCVVGARCDYFAVICRLIGQYCRSAGAGVCRLIADRRHGSSCPACDNRRRAHAAKCNGQMISVCSVYLSATATSVVTVVQN